MILTLWIGYALLVSACVGVAALAVERLLAIWSLPRRFVWVAALLLAVVLPARALIPATPRTRAAHLAGAVATTIARSKVRRAAPQPIPLVVRAERAALRLERFAKPAWTTASLLLALLFLRSLLGLAWRRRTWREDRLRGGAVLVAPSSGPAVVGVVHPRIVIPEWALALGSVELSLLLRHEREHVDARDPAALLLATLLLIALPWNAALWWIAHRLRLAIEIDCDARVLRAIDAPREYGMLLLAVGERRSLALPLSAALAERRTLLERRIHAMTSLRPRRPLVASLPFAAVALAASVAVAQSSPPSSVVMEKTMVQAKLAAELRAQLESPIPLTQLYTMLAAHLPAALQSEAEGNMVTLVVDAKDNYVGAVMGRAPVEVPMSAELSPLMKERVSAEKQAVDDAQVKRRVGLVAMEAATRIRADTLVIEGLGTLTNADIQLIMKRRYERGELGPAALNVMIVKLKQ